VQLIRPMDCFHVQPRYQIVPNDEGMWRLNLTTGDSGTLQCGV
jgi:hypothetical protein